MNIDPVRRCLREKLFFTQEGRSSGSANAQDELSSTRPSLARQAIPLDRMFVSHSEEILGEPVASAKQKRRGELLSAPFLGFTF